MNARCAPALVFAAGLLGCATTERDGPPAQIRSVGSSTAAVLVRDAEPVLGRAVFEVDVEEVGRAGKE